MEPLQIIGYANYKIYSDGRVWSKIGKGRFLKPWIDNKGYYRVDLSKNGKPKSLKIHRLLMQNFKPDEYDENLDVDHINRIKTDKGWEFQKRLNKLTYRKYFKTLEQAIEFKNVFCIIHNVERL